jgi:ribonuclease D
MWEPAGSDEAAVAEQLRELGAREWQIALTAPMLAEAVVSAQPDCDATCALA